MNIAKTVPAYFTLRNHSRELATREMAQWEETKDKHLVIYHAISPGVACDDGFAAYWVAFNRLADQDTYILPYEGIYGQDPLYNLIDSETHVHILDFSYDVRVLNVIGARAKSVILLDHHKSAMERWESEKNFYAWKNKSTIHFDMTRSGAMLAWNFYNPVGLKPPKLITHIQDNDLWQFKCSNTKEFISALRSYPQTLNQWDIVADNSARFYDSVINEGRTIERYYRQKLKEIIATGKELCQILEHKGLCCNAPKMFASDIGHILANESGTFGATWFKKSDGSVEWSLRCNDGFDVSILAKAFGGGGHAKASGFSIHPTELLNSSDPEVTGNTGIKLWKP